MDDLLDNDFLLSPWQDMNMSACPEGMAAQNSGVLGDPVGVYERNASNLTIHMMPTTHTIGTTGNSPNGSTSGLVNGNSSYDFHEGLYHGGNRLGESLATSPGCVNGCQESKFFIHGAVENCPKSGSMGFHLNMGSAVAFPSLCSPNTRASIGAIGHHSTGFQQIRDSQAISPLRTSSQAGVRGPSSRLSQEELCTVGLHGDFAANEAAMLEPALQQLESYAAATLLEQDLVRESSFLPFTGGLSMPLGRGGMQQPQLQFSQADEETNPIKPLINQSSISNLPSPPTEVINGVAKPRARARRGQATDPHSIAERLRREKIAERMRNLQQLIPNPNKTDKASMLDEIIEYVKFLQLQVKVLSMSRLGAAGAIVPLITDAQPEGSGSLLLPASVGKGHDLSDSADKIAFEQEVVKLMESDVTSAMQFLQTKGLCLIPTALAAAISSSTSSSNTPERTKSMPSLGITLSNGSATTSSAGTRHPSSVEGGISSEANNEVVVSDRSGAVKQEETQ